MRIEDQIDRPYAKIISGLGGRDLHRVATLAEVYTLAGADWLDVDLDPGVVEAAQAGVRRALDQGARRPCRIMVSCGLQGDPHVGAALLDASVCATCPGCTIPDLLACAQRPLALRAPECPSCQKCFDACPRGAIRVARPMSAALAGLQACLDLGAEGLEVHVAGASAEIAQRVLAEVDGQWPAERWLSVSVGAQAHRFDDLLAVADVAARLGRPRWMLQVEGPPMQGQRQDGGGDEVSLLRVAEVLAARPLLPVQVAGGTGQGTGARCLERGIPVVGVGFGTTARNLVAGALEPGASAADRDAALRLATQLVESVGLGRPLQSQWSAP